MGSCCFVSVSYLLENLKASHLKIVLRVAAASGSSDHHLLINRQPYDCPSGVAMYLMGIELRVSFSRYFCLFISKLQDVPPNFNSNSIPPFYQPPPLGSFYHFQPCSQVQKLSAQLSP
jgi:hypothetical protein